MPPLSQWLSLNKWGGEWEARDYKQRTYICNTCKKRHVNEFCIHFNLNSKKKKELEVITASQIGHGRHLSFLVILTSSFPEMMGETVTKIFQALRSTENQTNSFVWWQTAGNVIDSGLKILKIK